MITRGLNLSNDDPALWVIDHPEIVLSIHGLDIEAGSDALLTNTFGANRVWLNRYGRGDESAAINRRAVEIARLAAGPSRFVFGSIGPTGSLVPYALLEQAEALCEAGADGLLLETHRLSEAEAALRLLRNLGMPILASLVTWPIAVNEAAKSLADLGAMAIGSNCQVGMIPTLELARRLRKASELPLLFKPAASLPGLTLETPESFGAAVKELMDLGVRLIGGCCETTEAHLAAIRIELDLLSNLYPTE